MKKDVLLWAEGKQATKIPSKETLNHAELIEMVSGLDVYQHTAEAYLRAYRALGIDIINRVPLKNAPPPTPLDAVRPHPVLPYEYAHLGVYDTVQRTRYLCETPEQVWDIDVNQIDYQRDLITPVPHPCAENDIRAREESLGEIGLYYPMLYTTLFMWAVETLGWTPFMMAAAMEADRFDEHFLQPVVRKSKAIIDVLVRGSNSPFVFVHDDLASKTGPMFHPKWYDRHIFPYYPALFAPVKAAGKKVIFVADGNMTHFLPKLVESGIDGLMFETPATPIEAVIEHFGAPDQHFIGGVDTKVLTFGTPAEVASMVELLWKKVEGISGFALASGGGLHGNIPLKNLEAYFDVRAEIGATPQDWRTCFL